MADNWYIKVNGEGDVIGGYSDDFRTPEEGDILLGRLGRHFGLRLKDDKGRWRYRWTGSEVIEKSESERYDLAAEKAALREKVKVYARGLIREKVLSLSSEMGESDVGNNAIWLILLQDGRDATLRTYCGTVRDQVLAKLSEINSAENRGELEAITIPWKPFLSPAFREVVAHRPDDIL